MSRLPGAPSGPPAGPSRPGTSARGTGGRPSARPPRDPISGGPIDGPAEPAGPDPRRVSSGGPWEEAYGYSRAVVAGPFVLVSGCTSTVDGRVRHEGDAAWQARTALRIALAALEQAGAKRGDVVRTRMYLVNIERDADAVGKVHGEIFGDVRPAATMIGVARLLDPKMLVEIELEAYVELA